MGVSFRENACHGKTLAVLFRFTFGRRIGKSV